MSLFKKEKSLAELEEETEHTDAEIGLLEKQLIKKQIETRLGKGGMSTFNEGDGQQGTFKRAVNWLKTH